MTAQPGGGARLLRVDEVAARVGYSRVHIYRLERDGRFPRRVRLGLNRVVWLESEIEKWLRRKAEARSNEDAGDASDGAGG